MPPQRGSVGIEEVVCEGEIDEMTVGVDVVLTAKAVDAVLGLIPLVASEVERPLECAGESTSSIWQATDHEVHRITSGGVGGFIALMTLIWFLGTQAKMATGRNFRAGRWLAAYHFK